MLNREFGRSVIIAFSIACPVSWYLMQLWLEGFSYKTEISWWIFAISGLIAIGIAFLSVSWQSYRSARKNPVDILRYE
jgi:putative ABC transport system permease protein